MADTASRKPELLSCARTRLSLTQDRSEDIYSCHCLDTRFIHQANYKLVLSPSSTAINPMGRNACKSDVRVCRWPRGCSFHDKSPFPHSRVKTPDPDQTAHFIITTQSKCPGRLRGRNCAQGGKPTRPLWASLYLPEPPPLTVFFSFSPICLHASRLKILTFLAYPYGIFFSLFPLPISF